MLSSTNIDSLLRLSDELAKGVEVNQLSNPTQNRLVRQVTAPERNRSAP